MKYQVRESRSYLLTILVLTICVAIVGILVNLAIQHWNILFLDTLFIVISAALIYWVKRDKQLMLISHIYTLMLLLLLVVLTLSSENRNFGSLWFLVVPLIAFWLFEIWIALIYSSIAFILNLLSLTYYNIDIGVPTIIQINLIFIFIIGNYNLLNISRIKAMNKVDSYVDHLHERVDEALKKQKEQERLLIQASKMATLGELMQSIVHQWKQPMSSISMIGTTIRIDESLKGESADMNLLQQCEEIEKQVEFMVDTMNDFRNFSKSQKKAECFDVIKASAGLIKLFSDSFVSRGIVFKFEPLNEGITVFGYENMYKQALLNIILNAKDAIDERAASNKEIRISFQQDAKSISVLVEDHAGGIDSHHLQELFKRDFTTKGDKGSGIGLAMAKEIIEDLCAGTISAQNSDNGALFMMTMPIYKEREKNL